MHPKPLALLLMILSLCSASLANALSLSDDGIVVDDGAKGQVTLRYPRPCDAAKKPIKISEKKVDGQTATLKFEGGGSSVVDISSGAIVVKSSDIPDTTKFFQASVVLPFAYTEGGSYTTGDDVVPFPKEKAEKVNVAQGNQRNFTIKSAAGGKVSITVPQHGFQQLQDHRYYGDAKQFQWTVWINHYPEAGSFTIQIDDEAVPKPAPKPKAAAPKAEKTEMVKPVVPEQVKNVDGTELKKWKDGKKAAFYLAFDDACPTDLTNVIPELQKRKIVGTFYVVGGGGLFADQPKWSEAAKSPYVVLANHTFMHKGSPTLEAFEEEVVKCREAINKRLPNLKPDRLMSYGKPGGVKWGDEVTDAAMKPILAKHNLIDRQPFWGAAIHVKTNADMEKLVDAAIAKGEVGHLDFHGVGGDWLACTMEFFNATLDKLEKHRDDLWVIDPISAHKYAVERKGAELKVIEKGDKQIKISLTTTADPALYDAPLTLSTRVPAEWKSVLVTQGETKATVEVKDGVAMYNAMPGSTGIVLSPAP